MEQLKKDFKYLLRGYKIIFSIDTSLILLSITGAVLEAVYPFIGIFMGAEILNGLSRGEDVKKIYFLLVIMLASNFFAQQAKQFITRLLDVKNEVFDHMFMMFLNNKTLDMEYNSVENPQTHIKKQRIEEIKKWGFGGIWKLISQSREAVNGLFTIITSVVITYKAFAVFDTVPQRGFVNVITSPVGSVVLLLFIILNTLISMKINAAGTKKTHKTWDEIIPQNRYLSYINGNYINSYHAGKDIRLYNQKNMIMDSFRKLTIYAVDSIIARLRRYQTRYSNINTFLSSVLSLLVYIFIGVKALYGLIALGDLFKYINSITQFSTGLSKFLNSFNALRTNNEYMEVLFDFLDIPNASHQGTLTTEKRADNEYEIEFHNVSFKYSGSDVFALKNLSLKFNIGKRMAIVGMNGSGKTTVIKLLCRLYDPTDGEITLNGIDIRNYEYEEYLNIFSVVFQDFKLFSFPLGQNVAADVNYDCARAERYLKMAGLGDRLSEMPKGLDTPLYKDFEEDGVEVSGGEAQKIALARALYKDAPFIILDEPTAALDPVAEFEIYSKFNEIIGDKTAVYISHRLSSCRFCDDIAVFHEGELIQRDSHDALLADKDGKYCELWNAQAQYYTENVS